MPISSNFDPNLHIDVSQDFSDDINPNVGLPNFSPIEMPSFDPNFQPIEISDGQVSIPNIGPDAGVSGYSTQPGMSFWEEQQRQAERLRAEKEARDTQRRKDDEEGRFAERFARRYRDEGPATRQGDTTVRSVADVAQNDQVSSQASPADVVTPRVTTEAANEAPGMSEAPAQARPTYPYRQESVNVIDMSGAQDAEDVEYEKAEGERIKRDEHTEASQDARRAASERAEAISRDESSRRSIATVHDSGNNSSEGKPPVFRTLMKDVLDGVKRRTRDLLSNRRSPSQKGYVSDKFADDFKNRKIGNGFYAQMVQNPNRELRLHQVGVGWQEVVALVEQDPALFEKLLRDSGCVFDTIVPELGEPVDIEKIRRIVNYADGGVWVTVSKSPEVTDANIHRMQLIILDDMERGLAFHPIIAPLFNADFDGDKAFVYFDKSVADMALSSMDHLVSWEGRTNVNGDWVPSVGLSEGTDVRKFVRDNIFGQWDDGSDRIDGIVDAMSKILENEFADSDQKMAMWADLFRKARAMAGNDDVLMSNVVQTAYEFARDLAYDTLLQRSGTPISPENLPEPETDSDRLLFDVVRRFVESELPNNWQSFRTMFRSFPGNIEGKNPAFRFTGDIGRAYAVDPRIRTEIDKRLLKDDGDYEVISDDDWKTFHMMVSKYVQAERMAIEKRKDERWQASRDAFRMRTIRRICSYRNPSMNLYAKDVDLANGYPGRNGLDFEFIELFTRAYNVEVERANQAVAQFSDRYQHVDWGKQKLIEVDKDGFPVSLDQLAEPLLQVYPDLRMDHVFPALEWRESDRRWEGNPDHVRSGLHSYENESGDNEDKDGKGSEYWILSRYDSMSILNFSRNNRVIWNKARAVQRMSRKYSDIKRDGKITRLQYGIMLAIADKKTSSASTFNKALTGSYDSKSRQLCHRDSSGRMHYYDATKASNRHAGASVNGYQKTAMDKFADAICELVYLDDNKIEDRAIEIEKIVFMVTELFPDMARYFDIDSVEGFFESGYGRILAEFARNAMRPGATQEEKNKLVDRFASTYLSMVFDYEMDTVYRKSATLEMANVDGTAEGVAESTNALAFAWNRLAAKSDVWRGIVKEIQSGGEGWKALHEMALEDKKSGDSRLLYPRYWETHESGSIVDVIQDTNILYGQKVDIITDIVRWQLNDPWISTYEIPFGMRISDNQLYSLSSANRKSALGDITNFADAYSSYSKISRYHMHKEVEDAFKAYGGPKNRGRLLRSIRNLNRMPWLVRQMSDAHYTSVFVAILDKTSHQLEKGSQAEEPNYIYQGLTTTHTDGAHSDLYQTDSRVLGTISIDKVGISDFIRILSDPDENLYVYDHRGAMSIVNASALLFGELDHDMSNDAEVDERLWQFLRENPRLASMLRLHEVCSSPGGAWVGVSGNGSLVEMINRMGNELMKVNPIDHAKFLMQDHPGFASVLVLCDPIGNRTSRSYPKSVEGTMNYLLYRMCKEARDVSSGRKDVFDSATEILEEFGVTEESLIEANKTDNLKRLEELGMADERDYELSSEQAGEASEIYEIARGYVMKYLNEISNEVDLSWMPSIEDYKAPKDIGDRKPNRESFSAFIDINQELGASKTATSTGVNGMTTFDHVEWVRFIDAQDQYVDLDWAMACAETDEEYLLGFDGAMTSVVDHDGKFVPFEAKVDENGKVVTNYDALRELGGKGEIVIHGNGARLRDRSTRKDGKVKPALFKQMESKRAKASEALNLKLKKFGLDVLDSIIKMKSKYRKDIDYMQILQAVNQVYEANDHDLMAVHLMLAYELLDAAQGIGYKDLSLSDFTCIASLMTIVGEDGYVYVRSIEQLSNAIRYATSRLDHKPSDKEMRDFVNKIVNDNSIGSGVGIMTFDAVEAFDEWRPAKAASAILPTRHASSNETRNHAMLDAIEKEQYDPTKPEFTEADASRLRNEILYKKHKKDNGATTSTSRVSQRGKREETGDPNLSRVFFRCKSGMARDYIPIGGIGSWAALKSWTKTKVSTTRGKSTGNAQSKMHPYRKIPKNAIGPRYAYIVGDGDVTAKEFQEAVNMCYKHGITMIVSRKHIGLVESCEKMGDADLENGLLADALEASESGDVIIPFFDMRLNGSEALPIQGHGAMFTVPTYDIYQVTYEDRSKRLADASPKVFRHSANRTRVVEEDELSVSGDNLFSNVYFNLGYSRYDKDIREATAQEVEDMIINADELPSIDIGISESNSEESRRHARDVAWAIERYKDRWILLGGNVTDTVSTDLKPGDIVSWQICEMTNPETGDVRRVFAPVIPFPLHGSKSVPSKYSITSLTYDGSTGYEAGVLNVKWKNESTIKGNTVKILDPMSYATKGVAYVPTDEFSDPDDDLVVLETGTMIDFAVEEVATSSRKEGTDKRLKSLVTLMIELRKQGYNFGKTEGAFPDNPELAERVGLGSYMKATEGEGDEQTEIQVGRITRTEWRKLLSDRSFRFSTDQRINKLLWVESMKFLDAGWNPSDFMANVLEYEDGTVRNSGEMWEFETTLEPRFDYEDALLHFFHTVNPKFCPDGVDDMSEDHFFRMWRNDSDGTATGYDAGQVQMKVPVKDSSGNWYQLWSNVYAGRGFYAKQSTTLDRPNVTTAKFNPSAAHAMAYTHYGLAFDKSRESDLLDWALGGMHTNWANKESSNAAATAGAASVNDATPFSQQPGRSVTENADVVDEVSNGSVEVPDVNADDVAEAASTSQAEPSIDVPTKPFRNIATSRPAGNYSFILDQGFRQYEREQADARNKTRTVDQGRVDEAKSAFVSGSGNRNVDSRLVTEEDLIEYRNVSDEDIASYLGVTNDEVNDYLADMEMSESLDDYVDSIDDIDALYDALHRIASIGAFKRKYGDRTSTGETMYDIDFEDYDFTGKPVVSPIVEAVINGEVSDEVRMAYIFEVERKIAEDKGYLDEFLAYWTGSSVEEQLLNQIDDDGVLSEYLSGVGARATVDDVLEVESDANKARQALRKQRLSSYRKPSYMNGFSLPTYRYVVAYQRAAANLSDIADELDNAIKNVDATFVDVDGEDVSVGYGILLRLHDQCDVKTRNVLENVGGEKSPEMKDLSRIRKLVSKTSERIREQIKENEERRKKGKKAKKVPTVSRDMSELIDTVDRLDATLARINDLMGRADKVLRRDIASDLESSARQQLAEQVAAQRQNARQAEVEKVEGWRRIKNHSDPTAAVLGRISDALAPRVKRSQKMLHDFLMGDGGTERQRQLAEMGMKFIESVENPTKILSTSFHGEVRTEARIRTKKGEKTTVQVTEARPSWGEENDVWIERAQEWLGTGGGMMRVMRVVMHRMSLGFAPDGTISHVAAEDFRVSDRQLREVLKDIIAYCERGMSPTDLSDSVRGDPRASRDDTGEFVVIGGTKRYPTFMSRGLWYEICSDPTSKFYVEGESPSKVADERYVAGVEAWTRDVRSIVEREGDVEQLAAIDNLARAVLSMDGQSDAMAALPEIQTSLDIAALEADAMRSDDPDIYVPLEYMIDQMRESADREYRRQKHRAETDSRMNQIIKAMNRQRRTSGSLRASILISSMPEEGENVIRANVANALVNMAQNGSDAISGKDSKRLQDTQFDYNDAEYKDVTTSESFSENMQIMAALYRIGGWDLIDFYLNEKDEAGRAVNVKLNKAELNGFLIRYGYIQPPSSSGQTGVKGAVDKAKDVTRATMAMAEKVMTDFAMSEGLPGFSKAEARTFAKVYMSDARTLYGDMERRGERGEDAYAYAVDVADAVAMAQSAGTAALVRKMMTTPTGREALSTMGFFGAGRKNPITHAMQRLMWSNGVVEMLVSTCINKYPTYGIGKFLDQAPLSSTACYLATCGYSHVGDMLALAGESGRLGSGRIAEAAISAGRAMGRAGNYQMGTRSASLTVDKRTGAVRQNRLSLAGFRKNLVYDMTMAGSTLGKVLITMQIIKKFGLTPPEDPDNRLLYEEWRIGGEDGVPFKLAWWLDDLTGVSIPVAMGLLINEGGSWDFTDENGNVVATYDGGELAPSVIINGIASLNDGTFVFEGIDLFTHWDEHWRKMLGMDDFDKIGNAAEGELAPSSVEEWAIITTRNALLNQFGQLLPAIVNEVVPTSKDFMFAGERLETSPYLLWNTRGGKISLEEAKESGYTTGVDDWGELKLRQITRNYWVLGKIMDVMTNPQTGYTWAEMPKSERIDKAAYAKWSEYSFDFSDMPRDVDPASWLTMQGQAVYDYILNNYRSADDAAMDGFYLSYDALTNTRAYCESLRNQLYIDKEEALASIKGVGGSYNEIKAKILEETKRQSDNIKIVNDILWSDNFPTSVPKYNQQTTVWGTRYTDANGNPSDYIQYMLGNAEEETYAYGANPNQLLPIYRQRQTNKVWNNESIPWNFTGDEELDKQTAAGMYRDLVENGLTFQNRDGSVEDLGKTYFGGTMSPEGLMLGPDNIPTTGSRIDVPKVASLPPFLRTKDDMEDYYKKATGIEFGSLASTSGGSSSSGTTGTASTNGNGASVPSPTATEGGVTGNSGLDAILGEYGIDGSNPSNGNTYNNYGYRYGNSYTGGGYYRYSGGSGGSKSSYSSYTPKIYSSSRNVNSKNPANLSVRQPYKASSGYLRPSFYTSGSRQAYLRMD